MKINNDTEMQLYEVVNSEDNSKLKIAAINFNDLQKDLIENSIEPDSITNIGEVYITNGILKYK